jgi:hypothetical protein
MGPRQKTKKVDELSIQKLTPVSQETSGNVDNQSRQLSALVVQG